MKARWQDWINLTLGVWLFFSPWLLNYNMTAGIAAWDSYGIGWAIFLFTLWSLFDEKALGERFNAAFGSWLIVSPWVLGFSHHITPTVNLVVVGLLVALIAGSAMIGMGTPRPMPSARA